MKMRKNAQSILEYSVLICIVVAALLSMQVYLKRAMQGRTRSYADEISGGFGYSPGAVNSNSTVTKIVGEHSESSSEDGATGAYKTSVSVTNVTVSQVTSKQERIASFSE